MEEGHYPEYMLGDNQKDCPENVNLFKSALAGSLSGVESAIKKGGKVNFFFRPEDQKNALHVAAEGGYEDIVRLLLKNGGAVDSVDGKNHSSALLLAARNDHTNVMKALLENGANIHLQNAFGSSALHEAAQNGSSEAIAVLLRGNADPNVRNHRGSVPLHFVCYHEDAGCGVKAALMLIEAGTDVNVRDERGYTPLLVCCQTGRNDLIDLLLEHGANPGVKEASGMSAYQVAMFHHKHKIAERFGVDSPAQRFK